MQCPVCQWLAVQEGERLGGTRSITCFVCGTYFLDDTCEACLPSLLERPHASLLIAHWLRWSQTEGRQTSLTRQIAERVIAGEIPTPLNQAQNLILWLGTSSPAFGNSVNIHPLLGQIIMGSADTEGYLGVLRHLRDTGLVYGIPLAPSVSREISISLSFEGWAHYEALLRGRSDERFLFMAMPFGNPRMDKVFGEFKETVKATGFVLSRVDEHPGAGLIDDKLRVQIRRSAMVIADLTGNNSGAYWEAGFAEGLGKPVLYTCEIAFFRRLPPFQESGGTHFDTNHFFTVLWDYDNLPIACESLKAAVRVTLPHLAKMDDE
jgi:hypothetical protein